MNDLEKFEQNLQWAFIVLLTLLVAVILISLSTKKPTSPDMNGIYISCHILSHNSERVLLECVPVDTENVAPLGVGLR